jgi:glycerate-2-kinase
VKISNHAALAVTTARTAALDIAEAGLDAIDTAAAVRRSVRLSGEVLQVGDEVWPLRPSGRLLLVAVGTCATVAAAELVRLLGDRLDDGVVLDVDAAPARDLGPLLSLRGSHPLPSGRNVAATRRIVDLLRGAREDDLVLCVVSGGGSTLLCLPSDGGSAEAESVTFQALTRTGATIQEINTVRKHTSLARGGFLAQHAYPARLVSLVFSDVPGAPADFVASGPTVRDPTTVEDAARVLRRYGVAAAARTSQLALLETPKESRYFERARTIVLVSNETALQAMATRAGALGYAATIVTSTLVGEAREAGELVVRELRAAAPATALLYGGETTVTVTGGGRGGRNLEVALAAQRLVGDGEIVVTVASDGRDNGDFAGAVADSLARANARRLGLDLDAHLADNDSCGFFERTGDYLVTGSTGSNVADLIVALRD